MRLRSCVLSLLVLLLVVMGRSAASDPYLGEIRMFAGNFAPRGWALCNGQMMAVNKNTALFSLLGTNYGGDGRTTFALPDLRGCAPIHAGNGFRLGRKRMFPHPKATGGADQQQGYLPINFIIAVQGIYPSRN